MPGSQPLILCADPSEERVQAVREALKRHGFEVSAPANAADLVAQSRARRPLAIILHASMALADGWSVPECVRLVQSDIPVLLLIERPGDEKAIRGARIVCPASDLQSIEDCVLRLAAGS